MKNIWMLGCCLLLTLSVYSQKVLKIRMEDAVSRELLPGVTMRVVGHETGSISDSNGIGTISNLPNPPFRVAFSYVGYQPDTLFVHFSLQYDSVLFLLQPEAEMSDEVLISSTRTNARIEDLPVKVEVLGQDELDEEALLVPGGMGSLLGDLSVITIQRTNPVNGNDAVRMQGLDPGYTQLLQDGLPLYEGFSGSLGVLAIPPLDLRQVEIIKGSASTLYGGSAIGGLINFISRVPGEKPQTTFLFNQTTLGETNFNSFLSRRFKSEYGLTMLAAGTLKNPRDVNSDGYAEVPRNRTLLLHPRLFFYGKRKTSGDLGLTCVVNRLEGGDFEAVKKNESSALHPYLEQDNSTRTTLSGQLKSVLSDRFTLSLKGTGSLFSRKGNYAGFHFGGRQISSYSEANLLWKKGANSLVGGINLISEGFRTTSGDSVPFHDFQNVTTGFFAQNDWQISPAFALETGLRVDRHNRYGWQLLPRIGLFYKPSASVSFRLAYGTGYKTPDIFTAAEPVEYSRLHAADPGVRSNYAHSLNMDIGYHALLWESLGLQVNQALYFTRLLKPFTVLVDNSDGIYLLNASGQASSIGSDTYVQLTYKALEFYLGYNHTISEQHLPGGDLNTPFNPQDKLAATLAYSIGEKWRMGVESAFSANQYVENNRKVPSFWFFAAMIARQFQGWSLVVNCENIGDSRQSRHEPLVSGGFLNPVFAPIWGPVEGRVINLAIKISI